MRIVNTMATAFNCCNHKVSGLAREVEDNIEVTRSKVIRQPWETNRGTIGIKMDKCVIDNSRVDVRNVNCRNNAPELGVVHTKAFFLACNPKEYDGKGGAIVYTRWIEKMESI
ncbi:hypothetical protein Tco_0896718 [Tanacetum coccineum]